MIQQETDLIKPKEKDDVLEDHDREVLVACGFDPARVGKRIGRGLNSKVFTYDYA